MRSRSAAVLAVLALSASACASMPTSGATHFGRIVAAPGGLSDIDVRVFPPSWHTGLSPTAVVSGFLHAVVNDDDDYAIARSYLTPSAASTWRPDVGLTTYDDSTLQTTRSGNRIVVAASRLGRIDGRGGYQPAPGALTTTFAMSGSGTNWRIDHLPDGVLLSQSDAQRAFRLADVYYPNRAGTSLVPDPLLLQDSQRGIATALVTALLAGPSAWLAPAVRTSFPAGTSLLGTVPVHDDGVADVNLSGPIRSASNRDLAALSAQLVWTLRQVAGVTAVRLLADGAPLQVGQSARQAVTAWPSFDPAADPTAHGLLYVADGTLRATGTDASAVRRSDPGHVVSVARSRDGVTLAVVQQAGAHETLLVGHVGERLTPRLSALTMTTPTFDVDGRVLTVVTSAEGRRLVAVDPAGGARDLPLADDVLGTSVVALQVSRDGAHVAAVVGNGRLLIGRAAGGGDDESLGGFRAIAPGLRGVSGVAWSSADTVVVTAAGGPQRQLVETDIEGYSVRVLDSNAVSGSVVDVAAAPGLPLVVETSTGRLWSDKDAWHPLATGTAAVYSD